MDELKELKEHDVISKHFDNIVIDTYKKTKKLMIKCWNLSCTNHGTLCNFYEIIISPEEKKILVIGHQSGKPFEYRYYYVDLEHLEAIIKETFIQNCLYAKYGEQPVLKIKEVKNNEK